MSKGARFHRRTNIFAKTTYLELVGFMLGIIYRYHIILISIIVVRLYSKLGAQPLPMNIYMLALTTNLKSQSLDLLCIRCISNLGDHVRHDLRFRCGLQSHALASVPRITHLLSLLQGSPAIRHGIQPFIWLVV